MEDNIGSTNMKGFVMNMQREGKLHNAILVEQVRERERWFLQALKD